MDPALLARTSALGRIGFGAGMLALPRRLAEPWIGADARRPGVQVLTRCLGMRDLVLGAGTLAGRGREQQRWLLAALLADATDLTVTLAAGDRIPPRGRVLVGLAAGAGLGLGAAAIAGLRRG